MTRVSPIEKLFLRSLWYLLRMNFSIYATTVPQCFGQCMTQAYNEEIITCYWFKLPINRSKKKVEIQCSILLNETENCKLIGSRQN